jgi:tRNA-specific 2-thiouridylase
MKVLLGLSGGVDSAISAYLLQKEGHEVTGAFMRNWDALTNNDYLGNPTLNDAQCPQEKDYQDAKAVAQKLGIPLIRLDYVKEYWDEVFAYFLAEYKKGRTPNPDVLCNKNIKFGPFLAYATTHGFDRIAMGHYARKDTFEGLEYLYKPRDLAKDQTYFLCQLSEAQIRSCLFPMAEITKPEARALAQELGLKEVAAKHGSTGVCFIGERNFRQFLRNYFPATPGDIVDVETHKVLGRHEGVLYYTLGQRKGLGIGGVAGEPEGAWFVCQKDVAKNVLYVANGSEDEHLNSDSCLVVDLNWVGPKPEKPLHAVAKFRYRQADNPVTLEFRGNSLFLTYDKAVKAVTPGQFAAFYWEGRLLGGGIIDETFYKGKRADE